MATCPAGLRTMSKMAEGGAGIGRVTSMRSVRKTVSGTVRLLDQGWGNRASRGSDLQCSRRECGEHGGGDVGGRAGGVEGVARVAAELLEPRAEDGGGLEVGVGIGAGVSALARDVHR